MEPITPEKDRPVAELDAAALEQLQRAQELLKSHGFAILKPFAPIDDYSGGRAPTVPPEDLKVLMVLDFEATGKEAQTDLPIEIGFVQVQYDPNTGTLHRVIDRYSALEDPGIPIPPDSTKVHGLTDDDVRGKRFDDDRVNEAIDRADLVIAHNASYDRVLGERRFPKLAKKNWACSMKEGPWDEMTIGTKKQEFLAFKISGMHYGAHRAEADCEVLLHILSSPGLDGKTCFSTVLENARKLTYTVWADNSPFDAKGALKKDGKYRWSGDDPDKIKSTWFKDGLNEEQLNEQLAFLFEKVFRRPVNVTVDSMNAQDRYSTRHTTRAPRSLRRPESGLVESAHALSAGQAPQPSAAPEPVVTSEPAPAAPRRMGFARR